MPVSPTVGQGDGFVSVVLINTDKGFIASNAGDALLQGFVAARPRASRSYNGHGLAAIGKGPNFATANVETTLPRALRS